MKNRFMDTKDPSWYFAICIYLIPILVFMTGYCFLTYEEDKENNELLSFEQKIELQADEYTKLTGKDLSGEKVSSVYTLLLNKRLIEENIPSDQLQAICYKGSIERIIRKSSSSNSYELCPSINEDERRKKHFIFLTMITMMSFLLFITMQMLGVIFF